MALLYKITFTFWKNLGRLWLASTELQGDFTCYNSYLLTLHSKKWCVVPNRYNAPLIKIHFLQCIVHYLPASLNYTVETKQAKVTLYSLSAVEIRRHLRLDSYSVGNVFPVTRWLILSSAYESWQSMMVSHRAVDQLHSWDSSINMSPPDQHMDLDICHPKNIFKVPLYLIWWR